jgi:hypothetical protein
LFGAGVLGWGYALHLKRSKRSATTGTSNSEPT